MVGTALEADGTAVILPDSTAPHSGDPSNTTSAFVGILHDRRNYKLQQNLIS